MAAGSRRPSGIVIVVVLLPLLSLPAAARADEAATIAKLHNAAARKLFHLGKFKEAAREYEKAYQAKAVPEFLHNIAQCYRRLAALENLEKALFYFESYLNSAPDSPNRQEVEEEIAELKQQIEKLRQARVKPEEDRAQAPPAALAPGSEPPPTKAKPTPFYKTWWFWTAVGAVVVGSGVGITVAATRSDSRTPQGPVFDYSTFQ